MTEKLLIEEFADRILIIDDKKDEVEGLVEQLKLHDMSFEFFLPNELEKKELRKVRQLVFLDFKLDESRAEPAENIALIRKLLKQLFPITIRGEYGIVLWTSHIEYIDLVREKISSDRKDKKYHTPLFIVGLDKNYYITNGYTKCLTDLNNIILKDKAAYFFANWMVTVCKAAEKSITDVYSLVPQYNSQQTELLYILYRLALNHTGLPSALLTNDYNLSIDAYKAFDELLYTDLISQLDELWNDVLLPRPNNPWSKDKKYANEVFSKINRKLFIDNANIVTSVIVPGNVYRVVDKEEMILAQNPDMPDDAIEVALEITPPCDFSQKKKANSRILRGFICQNINDTKFGKAHYYKEIDHIEIEGCTDMQLVFDFRYVEFMPDQDLKNQSKFKLMFRVTPRLFADVLQKCSSYSARLGVSAIRD